jgi:hypothetical protein
VYAYFRVPKKEPRRSQWIAFMKVHNGPNWMPSKQLYLCSDHFLADDYSHGTSHKFLKEDALPTVFNKENNKEQANVSCWLAFYTQSRSQINLKKIKLRKNVNPEFLFYYLLQKRRLSPKKIPLKPSSINSPRKAFGQLNRYVKTTAWWNQLF